jgi:hypothetical protein
MIQRNCWRPGLSNKKTPEHYLLRVQELIGRIHIDQSSDLLGVVLVSDFSLGVLLLSPSLPLAVDGERLAPDGER